MQKVKLKNGFNVSLKGKPDKEVHTLKKPVTLAISPQRIPFIKARLLVRKGDMVKTGTALFEDKRDADIKYLSPGCGKITAIEYGHRRVIHEIVIEMSQTEEFETFKQISLKDLENIRKEEIVTLLKKGGLWQVLRQLPFRDSADSEKKPPQIIVSLSPSDMFGPQPGIYLKNREEDFSFGLSILKRLSDKIVITAPETELQELDTLKKYITHNVQGTYPAGDPAVFLYTTKKETAENSSWYINGQNLLSLARLFHSGKYPSEKMITVSGLNTGSSSHYQTKIGTPVADLPGYRDSYRIITGGLFNGIDVTDKSHVGFFEDSVIFIPDSSEDEFFGFIRPGSDKPSVSRTFLSSLSNKPQAYNSNINGELRACINCGYCEKICPVELLPHFIMKAVVTDELEESLELGILDCSGCGLCSYTCPSKIEVSGILKNAIHEYYKDRF